MASSTLTPASLNSVASLTSLSPYTPLTLNGVSQYASTLQSVLNRAVQIADVPLTALQNSDASVLSQETLLGTLQTDVNNFAGSLTALGTLAASQALGATSSNTSAVQATATGATAPATYTINSVTTAAAAASETSQNFYADSTSTPVSSTGTMELVVGSQSQVFTLTNNSLVGVRDEINSLNLGVNASILTTSTGNYLSVTASSTGATTLQLIDNPVTPSNPSGTNTNILTSNNQGTDAVFYLNNIKVDQPGNTVNSVIPGVTLNIVGPASSPVTVTLASDATRLGPALQSFVSAYNTLNQAVQAEVGPAGGSLTGQSVIEQLRTAMTRIESYYSPTGSVNDLAGLGITFDPTGTATYDGGTSISGFNSQQLSDAFTFLGSATSGLAGNSQTFSQIGDPVTGLIQSEQSGLQQSDQHLQNQMSALTDRINSMQTALASQLAAADAQIYALQIQQQSLSASLQGLGLVLYGKNAYQV